MGTNRKQFPILVKKRGNGLCLPIPMHFARELGIEEHNEIRYQIKGGIFATNTGHKVTVLEIHIHENNKDKDAVTRDKVTASMMNLRNLVSAKFRSAKPHPTSFG
jgi:antitoxin component of MazEF toxin-antitoxin module